MSRRNSRRASMAVGKFHDIGAKVKLGRKFGKDAVKPVEEEEPKSFFDDFANQCELANMTFIPEVVIRPKRPNTGQESLTITEELPNQPSQKGSVSIPPLKTATAGSPQKGKSSPPPSAKKAGRERKKKNTPPPPPPPPPPSEPQISLLRETSGPHAMSYITKERWQYFRPTVQVELENPEAFDSVTAFYIRGWKICSTVLSVLKFCSLRAEKLHTINLWRTGLTAETLELLADLVRSCSNMKILILDNNPVVEEPYNVLLQNNSTIQQLSLRYCDITDKGVGLLSKELGTCAAQNNKLTSLMLTGNKITDTGAEYLANALKFNRTLLSLGLGYNKIGDLGARKLAAVVTRFQLDQEEIVARRQQLAVALKTSRQDKPKSAPSSRKDQSAGKRSPKGRKGDEKEKPTKKRGKDDNDKKDEKGKKKTKEDDRSKAKDDDKKKNKDEKQKKALSSEGRRSNRSKGRKPFVDPLTSISQMSDQHMKSQNPLLNPVETLPGGVLVMSGNLVLLCLNLAGNKISEEGIKCLLDAIEKQKKMISERKVLLGDEGKPVSETHSLGTEEPPKAVHDRPRTAGERSKSPLDSSSRNKKSNRDKMKGSVVEKPKSPPVPMGLIRLPVHRNDVSGENETLQMLQSIMLTRDPFYKPPLQESYSEIIQSEFI